MTSVIDGLNELLYRERGEVEAVQELIREIANTDPDIADGARDALDTARWSCQGLHHRIEHIGGIPTLDTADLSEELSDKPNTKAKLEFLCGTQDADEALIQRLLKRDILDRDTRGFLEDLSKAHEETARWCKATLAEWKASL